MLGKLDIHMQKIKIKPLYHIKKNLKWIKDLNITPKTIKFLEENNGEKLQELDLAMIY